MTWWPFKSPLPEPELDETGFRSVERRVESTYRALREWRFCVQGRNPKDLPRSREPELKARYRKAAAEWPDRSERNIRRCHTLILALAQNPTAERKASLQAELVRRVTGVPVGTPGATVNL